MPVVENHFAPQSADIYDPDDVVPRDSPLLRPMIPKLMPSPSPPPSIPLPKISPDSSPGSPGRKHSRSRKARPSQSDAVLISMMDGGKRPELARTAGNEPLASDGEGSDQGYSPKGTEVTVEKSELPAIAARALMANEAHIPKTQPQISQSISLSTSLAPIKSLGLVGTPIDDVKLVLPSISAAYPDVRSFRETGIKLEPRPSPSSGELPPIQHLPHGNITLPSITDQLGDLNQLTEASPASDIKSYAPSPPGRPPPRFSSISGHGSPPRSPNDAIRRELPSPGRGHPGPGSSHYYHNRRQSGSDSQIYSSAGEYQSSNTETPSTDQSGSTPVTTGIDRMSIDSVTNPQGGGFQCTYPGCIAPPFQTQYLLNSHTNVHSTSRPHYCPVKGCPRGEGGKGFKRKNEMIRHGLVHDSPGYVCPFCPDREHKYPRPDNLQRHVRVHHTDKDKDDPQLRDVLSQRPEGPNRGRRRRGGTS
ncbi:hypothetical protein F5884DRAFT_663843 [Xylogone sp. PMI_703]|nr:hypothetical protein F5884DRAFT_663843 [Xylogone sp. PMI_703]